MSVLAGAARWNTLSRRLASGQVMVLVTFATIIVLSAVAAARAPSFDTLANVNDILRQGVGLGLAAMGQMLAILVAGIDLSVGSVAKLSEMMAAIIMNGEPALVVPAVAAALAIGLLVGAINGLLVTRLRIAPFIATFGMYGLVQGIAFLISTSPVGLAAPPVVNLYVLQTGPLYTLVLGFAIIAALVWVFLARTPTGRHVYAVGADAEVARLAGIRVDLLRVGIYMACGAFAALAGLFLLSRSGIGDPTLGDSYQFDSITAAVLGGTSLAGGRGGVVGTLGGVLLLSLIENVFNLMQVDASYQQLLEGAILLTAFSLYVQRTYTGGERGHV